MTDMSDPSLMRGANGDISDPGELTEAERIQMGRKHVLCVNGSATFLEFVRMLLEEERYNVTTTNFVPSTFAQIAALHPHLLIIDLEVGKRAGWELLERLRYDAATNDIPVIIVSTDHRLLERVQRDADRYGGSAYIVKPFDIDEMLNAVRNLIGTA
jgi:DNA-binding response OmpR family regulator